MPDSSDTQPEDRLQVMLNALLKAATAKDIMLTDKHLEGVLKILDHRRMCLEWAMRFRESNPNPDISAGHVVASAKIFEAYLEGAS